MSPTVYLLYNKIYTKSGSIGTGTCTCNRFDADIYMSSPDIPYNGHSTWLPSFIVAIMTSLKSGCEEEILKDLSAFYCKLEKH